MVGDAQEKTGEQMNLADVEKTEWGLRVHVRPFLCPQVPLNAVPRQVFFGSFYALPGFRDRAMPQLQHRSVPHFSGEYQT